MFWVWIGAAVVGALLLLILLAYFTRPQDYSEIESMVEDLDELEASRRHSEAKSLAARWFQKKPPLPTDRAEFNYHVHLALLTKDRIQLLAGLPNGKAMRRRWRKELVKEIKDIASSQDTRHGA
ncbi:MAG: hypothetical protein AAF468_10585 [Pseudomonadota bacterium]